MFYLLNSIFILFLENIVIQAVIVKFLPFKGKFLGNIVDTAHRPRVAPQKPPNSQRRAFYRTESLDGGAGIAAARRVILALRRSKRRNGFLIESYESQYDALHHFCLTGGKLRNILLMSDTPYFSIYPQYSVDLTVVIWLLATITISIPTGSLASASR